MIEVALNFLTSLIRQGAEAIAAGVVGLLVGLAFGAYGYGKARSFLGKDKRKPEDIHKELSEELDRLKESLHELDEAERQLTVEKNRLQLERDEACDRVEALSGEVEALTRQIQIVAETDGRVWEAPCNGAIPTFVQRWNRRARIISVANLKGGVGKTTLSANLGVALASLGQEVLLVDLDHQHSLSDLCFQGRFADLRESGRLVDSVFREDTLSPERFKQYVERVGERKLACVAADEPLSDAETRAMARWLVQQDTADVRYLLRRYLHDPAVSDRFDWIILDCPPRLTTSSINALTASDYLLIPAILDAPSMNAVPRLIRWIRRLKYEAGVCPDLSLLGLIANMTSQSPKLTAAEKDEWRKLRENADMVWGEPVYGFERFIPRKAAFAHAAAARAYAFAAEDPALKAIFLDLASEVRSRVPSHERRESRAISSNT